MKMKLLAAVVTTIILCSATPQSPAEDAPAYSRWKEFSDKVKNEPGLLVYYTFEGNEGNIKVPNQATGTDVKGYKPKLYHAEIEGTATITRKHGRWPGKGGVSLDGKSFLTAPDALYTQDMGKDKMPVTVLYWIYVAEADGGINGTIFSLGNEGEQRCSSHTPWAGSLFWDHGNIGAGGRLSTPYTDFYDKWHQIALVSEGKEGSFKAIYIDGEEIVSEASSNGPDVDLNGLWVGNCPAYEGSGGVPQIAKIDEFMIFARALSEKEIKKFYQAGKP